MTLKAAQTVPADARDATARVPPRIAVITPYHREEIEVLERCHRSVLAQTIACTHFLIADGPTDPRIESWDARRISLGVGHRDNGNTPRTIGGLCAMNEGFDCVAYLDADNWFAPDHLESVMRTQREHDAHAVFSFREIVFPDGEILGRDDDEDMRHAHVDTSCIVLFRPAFRLLSMWAEMPQVYGPICDRVAFRQLTEAFQCAWTGRKTVYFETWYWGHFTATGKLPPANAKYLPVRPPPVWEAANADYRIRSDTPKDTVGPVRDGPIPQIVTILGAPRSGSTVLQRQLCSVVSFFGIPENGFVFWFRALFGANPDAVHTGREIIERFARIGRDHPDHHWWSRHVVNLEGKLEPAAYYTAATAYRRVLLRTAPARMHRSAGDLGCVRIVDKTLTASLAADLLFRIEPTQLALLALRDPIDQICAMRRISAEKPGAWQEPHRRIEELCARFIEHLRMPLLHAPPGSLLVVCHEAFLADPERALKRVAAFCGVRTNPHPVPSRRVEDTEFKVNPVHQRGLERILAEIPKEIAGDEPWKDDSLTKDLAPRPHRYDPLSCLSSQEYAFARTVFQRFYAEGAPVYRNSPHRFAPGAKGVPLRGGTIQRLTEMVRLLATRLHDGKPHVC